VVVVAVVRQVVGVGIGRKWKWKLEEGEGEGGNEKEGGWNGIGVDGRVVGVHVREWGEVGEEVYLFPFFPSPSPFLSQQTRVLHPHDA
jgi:hypothetical protein